MAKNNNANLKLLQDKQFRNEVTERKIKLFNQQKWERFRQNRTIIVDKYVAARKTQTIAEFYVKLIDLLFILKHISACYAENKRECLKKLKGVYMNLVIAQIWRRRSKKFRAEPYLYENVYINKMRHIMTLMTTCLYPSYEIYLYSGKILLAFIIDNGKNMDFRNKLITFFRMINYI